MNSCTSLKPTENEELENHKKLVKTIMIEADRISSLINCKEKEHCENVLEFLVQLQIITSTKLK